MITTKHLWEYKAVIDGEVVEPGDTRLFEFPTKLEGYIITDTTNVISAVVGTKEAILGTDSPTHKITNVDIINLEYKQAVNYFHCDDCKVSSDGNK